MKNDLLSLMRKELKKQSSLDKKIDSQRFFKEKIKVYGVKNPKVKKIAKKFFKEVKNKDKDEIFNLCEELFCSGYMEEALIACDWSYFLYKRYETKDIKLFEEWLKLYITNWAVCDTFCNHTVGTFLELNPEHLSVLLKWAESKNRWVRRGAAVSLIVPAKKGKFLDIILTIADLLLMDKDDLVQKGYGWLLKVASKNYQNEVFTYVCKNKKIMPRTALRYAIEKMPQEMRAEAMKL